MDISLLHYKGQDLPLGVFNNKYLVIVKYRVRDFIFLQKVNFPTTATKKQQKIKLEKSFGVSSSLIQILCPGGVQKLEPMSLKLLCDGKRRMVAVVDDSG